MIEHLVEILRLEEPCLDRSRGIDGRDNRLQWCSLLLSFSYLLNDELVLVAALEIVSKVTPIATEL